MPPPTLLLDSMRRLIALLALSLTVAACTSDEAPVVPDDAPVITVEPGGDVFVEDMPGVAETRPGQSRTAGATSPAAPPPADASVPTSDVPPLRGVAVCEALKPALTAHRLNATDVGLYATQPVIDVLRENELFRPAGDLAAADLTAWTDDGASNTCNLSAGGDAWYVLTLTPRGEGQLATAVRLTSSYENGGP